MITVSVSLPEYLAQWSRCRLGGIAENKNDVLVPKKGSPISQFLRNFLRHKKFRPAHGVPEGARSAVADGIDKIIIAVPHFPGRDPQYFNYLSPVAEAQLRDLIRSSFDFELFKDFLRFENVNTPINEFILSWIEANGIENSEKNWLAVEKRLQLLRRKSADRQRKAKRKNV